MKSATLVAFKVQVVCPHCGHLQAINNGWEYAWTSEDLAKQKSLRCTDGRCRETFRLPKTVTLA